MNECIFSFCDLNKQIMTADEIKKMEEWCDWACANKERTSKVWKALRLGYIRGVYETEQKLNIHNVVRGVVTDDKTVPRPESTLAMQNFKTTIHTTPELLQGEAVAQSGRDGLCNCVNQFFGYVNCGYDCQRNKE
jgi:hypothetical protein